MIRRDCWTSTSYRHRHFHFAGRTLLLSGSSSALGDSGKAARDWGLLYSLRVHRFSLLPCGTFAGWIGRTMAVVVGPSSDAVGFHAGRRG